MAKVSSYASLAAASVAAGDKIFVTDVSVPANKNILASDIIQAGLLVSTGFAVLGSANVLSFGANGATNPALQVDAATASVVNGVKVTATATAVGPILTAIGSDTNATLDITGKGTTGGVRTGPFTIKKSTATATADTATLTVAQLLTHIIDGTPTGAANYTLPTAANLVAGITNAKVGDSFEFIINNKSGGANTITVLAGGATLRGTATIAQNVCRKFVVLITNVTGGAEAYTVYSC